MPVFREWALIAVYHQAEADDLEHFEEMTRNMSVMDFHWDETACTMIQVQTGVDKEGHPEYQTIATEQSPLFEQEGARQWRGAKLPKKLTKRQRMRQEEDRHKAQLWNSPQTGT